MDPLFEKVARILAPDLGENMARASIRLFLGQDRIAPEALEPRHLKGLVEKLKPGLIVFVGASRAEVMAQRILRLGQEGGT